MRNQKHNKFAPKIEAILDLHGLYEQEAITAVSSFLLASEKSEHNKVRIITGKGSGILQKSVRQYLQEQGYFFETAKINEGGSGALVITL